MNRNIPLTCDDANSIIRKYNYLLVSIASELYEIRGCGSTGFRLTKNSDHRIDVRIAYEYFSDHNIITTNGVQLFTIPTVPEQETPISDSDMLRNIDVEFTNQLVINGKPQDPNRVLEIKFKHYKWLLDKIYGYNLVK